MDNTLISFSFSLENASQERYTNLKLKRFSNVKKSNLLCLFFKKRCIKCPANKYSLNLNDKDCNVCPETAQCPGGSLLNVNDGFKNIINIKLFHIFCKTGYWRNSNLTDNIFECENPYVDVCLQIFIFGYSDEKIFFKGRT